MKHFLLWLPPFLWMGMIFFMSSRQGFSISPDHTVNFLSFKSLHVLEYAILFFLVHRAVKYGSSFTSPRIGLTTFVVVVLYAISDELHQTVVPTREGTIRDVVIDGVGATFAWMFVQYIPQRFPEKIAKWTNDRQLF